MSLVKSNALQLGQSITATNNFVLYQPASPDGTVRLGNGNSGSVTDLITVGSTGNLTLTGTAITLSNSAVISAASTKTLTLNGGGGSNGLVLDASNIVNIGTNSGGYWTGRGLNIAAPTSVLGAASQSGHAFFFSTDAVAADIGGSLALGGYYTGTTAFPFAGIAGKKENATSGNTAGYLQFLTNTNGGSPTERMRLDSSGNLGLGVTPSPWSGFRSLQIGGSTSIWSTTSGVGSSFFTNNGYYNGTNRIYLNNGYATEYIMDSPAGEHIWFTAPSGTAGNAISFTQAMTLSAAGGLSVGTTTDAGSGNIFANGIVKAFLYFWAAGDASNGGIYLGPAGAQNGRIGQNSLGSGTTTTYIGNAAITTSSDVRLKENIEDTKRNAVEIIKNLRVVDHTWNDPTDTCENNRNSRGVWMGLIAQEAIDHIPWLVNKPSSDEDEEGRPQYWHMDYGYSVPLLVKAIQELHQEIESLKARIN